MVVFLVKQHHHFRPGRDHPGQVELRVAFRELAPQVFTAGQFDEIVDEGQSAGHARMAAKPQFGIHPRTVRRRLGAQCGRLRLQPRRERVRGAHLTQQRPQSADIIQHTREAVGQRQHKHRTAGRGQSSRHPQLHPAGHEHQVGREPVEHGLVDPQIIAGHDAAGRVHVSPAIPGNPHHALREAHGPERLGPAGDETHHPLRPHGQRDQPVERLTAHGADRIHGNFRMRLDTNSAFTPKTSCSSFAVSTSWGRPTACSLPCESTAT